MLYLSKKLFSLLALLPPATLASSAVTKTFKFKEDFFIKFNPLPTAIGPDASVDVLMSALNGFAQQFQEVWIGSLKSNLQGGLCTVDQMRMNLPEFLMCDWKYPDRCDIDELPTPGQCYVYRNGFVQRIYYKIEELEITCPEDFSYEDLDKAAYTEAAFSGQDFLNVIKPASTDCDGNLFSGVDTVEWVTGYDVCNTTLYINRFVDVPVYLKCLDTDGYDRNIANELIKALDEYFELVVSKILAEKIMQQAPKGFIYNFASPYASDREYCAHGAYYAGGNLVDQVPDNDGTLITRFTYGFDVIWYKPRDFHDELLPGLEYIINKAFEEGEFLLFLQKEYPDSDFIEDIGFCDVIDPDEAEVTFAPTEESTSQPMEGPICDVDTNNHCLAGQVCRLSCVWGSSEPQCFEDEEERDCTGKWGPGWICLDTNKDGIISASENSDGCQYASPTASPSESPTLSPVNTVMTLSPTPLQVRPAETRYTTTYPIEDSSLSTPSPTCPKCIVHPNDTEEDECPIVTTGTCSDGDRGDGICPYAGYCCSKWGYCGTTSEYCDDDSVAPSPSDVEGAPLAPTYSVDAGQCSIRGEYM